MSGWKPIEQKDFSQPIWVLKYDIYFKDGQFCDKDTLGATKFTDCHGWYSTEAEALAVRNHMPTAGYRIEKVYRGVLI